MIRFQRLFAATLGVATSLALAPGMLVPSVEASPEPLMAQADAMDQVDATDIPCTKLQEVTTGETEVRKRIQNRVVARSNWHTDFLVPNSPEFDYYVALVTVENTGPYHLDIHLRLPQGGSEPAFSGRADVEAGTTYVIPFQSPTGRHPAVVNARLGGVNGNYYSISVAACES
ncbi:MAG: hypothetical protein EA342_08865 [Leptolyngbya sp. LCM1.Bin17]|nr:MAG: hypothetical protein EA342_08865 [Leptolyngbya sp. LCM1.Bin17]